MKETFREKINRDNGKHFQIGNHNLNAKEVVGYFFLIVALVIYLLVEKAEFQYGWLGWLSFASAMLFIYFGVKQNESQSNT